MGNQKNTKMPYSERVRLREERRAAKEKAVAAERMRYVCNPQGRFFPCWCWMTCSVGTSYEKLGYNSSKLIVHGTRK
jgi:hypothetical protein